MVGKTLARLYLQSFFASQLDLSNLVIHANNASLKLAYAANTMFEQLLSSFLFRFVSSCKFDILKIPFNQ